MRFEMAKMEKSLNLREQNLLKERATNKKLTAELEAKTHEAFEHAQEAHALARNLKRREDECKKCPVFSRPLNCFCGRGRRACTRVFRNTRSVSVTELAFFGAGAEKAELIAKLESKNSDLTNELHKSQAHVDRLEKQIASEQRQHVEVRLRLLLNKSCC
jgi:hypothetical protein